MATDQQRLLDDSFDRIERVIFPTISIMLDTLLDASEAEQPRADADKLAGELRALALQLEAMTRQMEGISRPQVPFGNYRAAARA